jgi:glycosyltransferase involved in cell wall biosynthesis
MAPRDAKSPEPITALVCTADRPAMLRQAVLSLLRNTHPSFEVIVVEQGEAGLGAAALEDLRGDARLRVLASPRNGKGAALNLGLAHVRTDLVACTDDDCTVPPDWLEAMSGVLAAHPDVAVVFGGVDAAGHDKQTGFIPTFSVVRDRLIVDLRQMARTRGLGACMGLRAATVRAIGGFDPWLGPGAAFRACEDWDIAFRALLAGHEVFDTASAPVIHHGFRSFSEGRGHSSRDWYGIGAVCVKPLRRGHWSIVLVAAELIFARALVPPLLDVMRLRRPRGLGRMTAFVAGAARAMRTPLRPDVLVFEAAGSGQQE